MTVASHGLMGSLERWVFTAWFRFLVRYRRTVLGPIWMLVAPTLFIATLGLLFAQIGARDITVFLPHLTIGIVVWTLISGFVMGGATVAQRNRQTILQGGLSLTDIVMVEVCSTLIMFLHQTVLIVVILAAFGVAQSWSSLISLFGLVLLVANGIWLTYVFAILGARYRDLSEIVQAIMRIAFLATPIIWMPDAVGGRSVVMSVFLAYNPFYHVLEVIRAPLLGTTIAPLTWAVAIGLPVLGSAVAYLLHQRYARFVPLWV